METSHLQTQESIARTQSQLPLFLHIFQNAQQLKQGNQTSQLQTSFKELSATGIREGSNAHSALVSSNLRTDTVKLLHSHLTPQHAPPHGISNFNKGGFYLQPDASVDPSSDDTADEKSQSCTSNDFTGDVLNLHSTSGVGDEGGCSYLPVREAISDKVLYRVGVVDDSFNASTRMEAIEDVLENRFSAPSTATHDCNCDALPVEVVTIDGVTSNKGTSIAIPDTYSSCVNNFFAFPTEVVTDITSAPDSSSVIGATALRLAMGGHEVRKLLPYEMGKEDEDHVSIVHGIHDDYPASMLGDDPSARLCGSPNLGTKSAQEISPVLAHVGAPSMEGQQASFGGLPPELNDAFSNSETDSLTYRQQWHRQFKGVSNSWQDVWKPQEDTSREDSAASDDYCDIISAVVKIAKCLPKNETLQEHLQPFSGHIDHLCGNAILYKLQKESLFLSAFSFFDWMRLQSPSLLNSRSLCTIFTILGDANMVDRALVLYNNLRHRKELWLVQVFNALLSALSKHCRYDEALAAFQDMSSMKIHPDSVTFCIVLNLAYKSGSRVEVLWQIFVDMEKQKVFASHEVFGVLIKAFCQEGLRIEALKLLSMMEGRGVIPNIVIYNTLIGAFAKSGMLEEAEGLVSEMKKKGICSTVVTYNILIDAYASIRNFDVAEAILQGMLEKGPRPDVQSFTALIAAYGRNFLSEKAAGVFLRMRKNGISPNTVAYTALIHAYAEDGWHKKAEFAFESMIREEVHPTVETYTSLLHAFRQADDLEKVKSIWKRMRTELNIGTRVTFNVLMDACAKQGDYAEARNVMYEFKKIGLKSTRRTYNMLLNAYTRGGQHSKAPEILEEMQKAGFSPDSYTYTTLIYSYLRVRDFTQAFEYYDEMCMKKQLPDKFTYQKLRALLDEKYEVKAERNMKAAIGAQRQVYEVEKRKKAKSFRKKQRRSWRQR